MYKNLKSSMYKVFFYFLINAFLIYLIILFFPVSNFCALILTTKL